jgi:dCMP deaminase
MIINAGIRKIIVSDGYPDDLAVTLLEEAGLKIVTLNREA